MSRANDESRLTNSGVKSGLAHDSAADGRAAWREDRLMTQDRRYCCLQVMPHCLGALLAERHVAIIDPSDISSPKSLCASFIRNQHY